MGVIYLRVICQYFVYVFVSLMRVFRLLYVLLLFSISMFRYGTAMTNSYCDSHFPTV